MLMYILKTKKKEIDHKRELTIYEYVIHRPIDYQSIYYSTYFLIHVCNLDKKKSSSILKKKITYEMQHKINLLIL